MKGILLAIFIITIVAAKGYAMSPTVFQGPNGNVSALPQYIGNPNGPAVSYMGPSTFGAPPQLGFMQDFNNHFAGRPGFSHVPFGVHPAAGFNPTNVWDHQRFHTSPYDINPAPYRWNVPHYQRFDNNGNVQAY